MTKTLLAALAALATLLLSTDPAAAQKRERDWTVYDAAPTAKRKASRAVRHAGPAITHGKIRYGKVRHGKVRHGRVRHASMRRGKATSGRLARAHRQPARIARVATAALQPPRASRANRLQVVSHAGGGATGLASYYYQGHTTASGARFNPEGMTAAHRSLPFGTRVRVTHTGNGRSVVVTINDRGPFIGGRIIDLSRGAAGVLGMHAQGVASVRMEVLGR